MSDFDKIAEKMISRRKILKSVATFGLGSFISTSFVSSGFSMKEGANYAKFREIPSSTSDTITLAEGFNWNLLVSWGDPLWSTEKEVDAVSRGNESSQRNSFGDNNDGMVLFSKDGKNILVVNNEYTNLNIMFGNNSSG